MIEEQAMNIYTFIEPIIGLVFISVIALWVKSIVEDIVAGIRWKMKPGFEPGDDCFLDGERATIVSIGYRETIFEIDNGRGKVWRYIDNKRIPVVRLEKLIKEKQK